MNEQRSAQPPDDRRPQADRTVWRQAGALFSEWRMGDPAAFDALVRLLTPVLWHVVRAYRLDRETAEDTVQSVWLALVRHADHIEDPAAIGAWLILTARRSAWRAGTVPRAVARSGDVLDALPGAGPSPDAAAIAAWETDALWATVATLSERCQRLLRLLAFGERPDYTQLARELAMPVGSIGPTRGRCLGKLRVALAHGEAS